MINLNGEEYFYIRNIQGDIIGLIDETGGEVVSYTYDTWGKVISITGSLANTVGEKNPYLYRGYRYDSETGLYYLQARYYNPEWGRFLNGDNFGGDTGSLLSHNVFAYCMNNPVNLSDPSGHFIQFIVAAVVIAFTVYDIYISYTNIYNAYQEGGTSAAAKQGAIEALDLPFKKIKTPISMAKKAGKGLSDAVSKTISNLSKKSIIKKSRFPTTGKIRYVPPDNWSPSQSLPKRDNGYIDKFGNIWVKGPSRTPGQQFEWDVQLSKTGRRQLGHLSRDGSHLMFL
ncbi:MAG TPA: wall-associated protein [Paenibacillaceae bacterium]|nr:wall-associated protein [Paenibacillaceae bacterium]